MLAKTFFLMSVSSVLLLSCSNPTGNNGTTHFFYAQVVDKAGNPVRGAEIHYMFNTYPTPLHNLKTICPSTHINYTLPKRGHVTIDVYRWYTNDFLGEPLNDTLDAGNYGMSIDNLNLTNGIYVCRVTADSSVTDIRFMMLDLDYSSLVTKTPLAVSDSQGNFSLPDGIFAFGVPFGNNDPGPIYISQNIDFVVHTPGNATFDQPVMIDTTSDMHQQFLLGQ